MEPLKLGVLGLDSTHFDAFYKIFSNNSSEIKIFYIQDNSEKVMIKRLEQFPELNQCTNNSRITECDCYMVLNRFGDAHLESLERVASFNKPIFIDKPISDSINTTMAIVEMAKKYNTPITSHSPLEFSKELQKLNILIKDNLAENTQNTLIISGPLECNDLGDDPRLKSPLFYGIHLSEMLSFFIQGRDYEISSSTSSFRSSIFIKIDKQNFIIDLYPDGEEFYNLSNYNNKNGYVNFTINLDGSYYSDFYKFLLSFFKGKVETNYALKSLEAMKIIDEVM
jgi:hypothetical protein